MPTLVCDLGNVLIGVSFERPLQRWRAANGGQLAISDPAFLQDDAYRAFETGELGESEYARHLRVQLGWRGDDQRLVGIWSDVFGAIDVDVLQVLADLRGEGWKLVAAMNTNPWHEPIWRRRFAEPLSVFDRVVTSTEIRVRKPDPRFYAEAIRGFGQEGFALFVDDRPENVSGARRAGLDGHLFRDAVGLRAACESLSAPVL